MSLNSSAYKSQPKKLIRRLISNLGTNKYQEEAPCRGLLHRRPYRRPRSLKRWHKKEQRLANHTNHQQTLCLRVMLCELQSDRFKDFLSMLAVRPLRSLGSSIWFGDFWLSQVVGQIIVFQISSIAFGLIFGSFARIALGKSFSIRLSSAKGASHSASQSIHSTCSHDIVCLCGDHFALGLADEFIISLAAEAFVTDGGVFEIQHHVGASDLAKKNTGSVDVGDLTAWTRGNLCAGVNYLMYN